jgi:hypothetical protein
LKINLLRFLIFIQLKKIVVHKIDNSFFTNHNTRIDTVDKTAHRSQESHNHLNYKLMLRSPIFQGKYNAVFRENRFRKP